MTSAIEVIVGTYSDYLLGYRIVQNVENGEIKYTFKHTFADNSHTGTIRCLDIQGPWVASGGDDDRIFIYNMHTRQQSYILQSHTSTVNSLVFSTDLSHLLSGDADGRMIATRVGDWKTAGDWKKPHGGNAITHIACHPTNRLAFSLGADNKLNTWNLVKGRVVYRTNLNSKSKLGKAVDCLVWSTDGKHFALTGRLAVELWDIESAGVARYIELPAKPVCLVWVSGEDCIVGLENGKIIWTSLSDDPDKEETEIAVHDTRVKAIAYLNEILVTISSSGDLKAWSCDIDSQDLQLLATTNIDCRPTCMGLVESKLLDFPRTASAKKTQPQMVEESDEEAEDQAEQSRPRGFVSVEYDADQTASVQQKKPKKQKRKNKKSTKVNDDDSSSSEDANSSEPKQKRAKKAAKKQPKGKSTKPVPAESSEDDSSNDSENNGASRSKSANKYDSSDDDDSEPYAKPQPADSNSDDETDSDN